MLVYNKFVTFEWSGVSGESVYVAYKTLSVHDGVRFVTMETIAEDFSRRFPFEGTARPRS